MKPPASVEPGEGALAGVEPDDREVGPGKTAVDGKPAV